MDSRTWRAIVPGVAISQTQLSTHTHTHTHRHTHTHTHLSYINTFISGYLYIINVHINSICIYIKYVYHRRSQEGVLSFAYRTWGRLPRRANASLELTRSSLNSTRHRGTWDTGKKMLEIASDVAEQRGVGSSTEIVP